MLLAIHTGAMSQTILIRLHLPLAPTLGRVMTVPRAPVQPLDDRCTPMTRAVCDVSAAVIEVLSWGAWEAALEESR